MNRRVIAAVAAVLLALLGAVLLIRYVNGADQRAMAEMEPVTVLVATAPIAQSTPAEEIAPIVIMEQIPAAAVGPGAVDSLDQLSGLVAATDVQAGEQILSGRFASPLDMQDFGGIPVPEGLHQVTIPLDSARVVGGTVTPGDLVGVFISVGERTHLALDKILVTRVQGGLSPGSANTNGAEGTASNADPAAAPEHQGGAMVTVAVNARDAETIIFAAENGSIWLTIVHPDAPRDGTRIVEPGNVY